MQCPRCKANLPPGTIVCGKCGARFKTEKCPKCGRDILAGSTECMYCHKKIKPGNQSAAAPAAGGKKPVTKRWWFWAVCAVLVIGIVGNIGQAMSRGKPDDAQKQSTATPAPAIVGETRSPAEAKEVLQWQIESGCENKYDGYTCDIGDKIVHVTVWRESIDNTFQLMQESGRSPDDEDWTRLINNTKNTSDYIADCIRTSDLPDLDLQFRVVDSSAHKQEFFIIQGSEIIYDALSEAASKPTATPTATPAPTATPVPAAPAAKPAETTPVPIEEEPTRVPTTTPIPVDPTKAPNPTYTTGGTVYWTPNGEKYHSTADCVSLKRSTTINNGTMEEAINSGHGEPCKLCH